MVGIAVISRRQTLTSRETITPASRDQVQELLAALISMARVEKITGRIHIDLLTGGVRAIHVERVEEKQAS